MAGIATFTIVVSSRIMKNPVVSTTRTSHGLVRAWAMLPPQRFMAGIDSDLPLQLAFVDLSLQLADPLALGVEHRDLVLDLDQRQAAHALGAAAPSRTVSNFVTMTLQSISALARGARRHAAASRWCMNISPAAKCGYSRRGCARSSPSVRRQDVATASVSSVDGSLGPPAFLLALDRDDPAVALEHLDRVVERAEVEADELVVVALAHRRGHLVGVHRLARRAARGSRGPEGETSDSSSGIFHMEYTVEIYPVQVLRPGIFTGRVVGLRESELACCQGAQAGGGSRGSREGPQGSAAGPKSRAKSATGDLRHG